jgi:hypothetical protein|tara:strand:+ start:291 stop:512 length:222 start_codon:yes stop_codon:yes gene_type:complete
MSDTKNFHKNLQILKKRVKERRKQELYDMMNEASNTMEDKIALIKMSLTELDGKELSDSFKSLINNDKKVKKE